MKAALLFGLAVIGLVTSVYATDWPHWRGPGFNGSSPESGLPTGFSPTNNVKWAVDLPGPSAATPIVWGNRVFVSSTDLKSKSLLALAFDRKTGQALWRHEVSPAFQKDDRSNYASPSPATDGKQVVFLYGNGELIAYDFAGSKLWSRSLEKDFGPFAYQFTYGSSPTICEGTLFVQVLQRDVPVDGRGRTDGPNESYLLALDPATGRELWRHIRANDALVESKEAYSTPVPYTHSIDAGQFATTNPATGVLVPSGTNNVNKHTEILVVGADCITGHDVEDGKELWRWGTWNAARSASGRLVPSPVVGPGVVLIAAPKGAPVYAAPLNQKGTLNSDALVWKSAGFEISSDVSTPAFYQGKFYVLNSDRKMIARVDPATGKPDWIGRLESRAKFESSPTAADGKLYFQSHAGEVFVIGTGPEFKVLHQVVMGGESDHDTRASIAVSRGNLFIRTAGKLYCIGK